jgi:hypothetical protein
MTEASPLGGRYGGERRRGAKHRNFFEASSLVCEFPQRLRRPFPSVRIRPVTPAEALDAAAEGKVPADPAAPAAEVGLYRGSADGSTETSLVRGAIGAEATEIFRQIY